MQYIDIVAFLGSVVVVLIGYYLGFKDGRNSAQWSGLKTNKTKSK